MFGIRFGDLEGLLRAPRRGTVAPRLKYLQRRRFPDGANPGAGGKVNYTLEQTLQVVIAFELLDGGVTPMAAAAIVRAGWEDSRAALIEAWWCRRVPGAFADRPMIVFEGLIDQDGVVFGGHSCFRRAATFASEMGDGFWPKRALVLDPVKIVIDLARLLPVVAGVGEDELSQAFDELAAALG